LGLIIARVLEPGSKLATTGWWADTTLGSDLGINDASTDETYAAMDWLHARQDSIEAKLARRRGGLPGMNPSGSEGRGRLGVMTDTEGSVHLVPGERLVGVVGRNDHVCQEFHLGQKCGIHERGIELLVRERAAVSGVPGLVDEEGHYRVVPRGRCPHTRQRLAD